MSRQWLRRVGLTVSAGGQALDLSNLQVQFQTTQMDVEGGYPPGARIRVLNPSEDTARQVSEEYQSVMLQAGYVEGDYGVIFEGTIKQIRRGRMSMTDTYLDILAADGDLARYALVNKSLASGWTAKDVAGTIGEATQSKGLTVDPTGLTGGVTGIRGKALFGLAMAQASALANSNGATWTIINGQMVFTPLTAYREGEAVVLNADSGMIGFPESTIEGIRVRCLLNPKIKMGTRIQIDNKSINQTTVKEPGFPRFGDRPFFASVTQDGFYRVIVVEHMGDSRDGPEWYSEITCLALDPSAAPGESVSAYGDRGVPFKASTNQ